MSEIYEEVMNEEVMPVEEEEVVDSEVDAEDSGNRNGFEGLIIGGLMFVGGVATLAVEKWVLPPAKKAWNNAKEKMEVKREERRQKKAMKELDKTVDNLVDENEEKADK